MISRVMVIIIYKLRRSTNGATISSRIYAFEHISVFAKNTPFQFWHRLAISDTLAAILSNFKYH